MLSLIPTNIVLHPPTKALSKTIPYAFIGIIIFIGSLLSNTVLASVNTEWKTTQAAIKQQQQLNVDALQTIQLQKSENRILAKKVIDKRVTIKQLELEVKRYTMRSDNNDSAIKNAHRTAKYKLKVANIELQKLKKKQVKAQQTFSQLLASQQAHEAEFVALSEQLARLDIKKKAAVAKQKKAQQQIIKNTPKKKNRVASARPQLLNSSEQSKLEHKQQLLRQQAQSPSSSLANTMLLNTQAIALVPIQGKPNLGFTPQVKRKSGKAKYQNIGLMEHLGNSQYRLKTQLKAGMNTFRVEEYEYRKAISRRDTGKFAWLIIDARSVKQPEFLLIKL